MNVVAPQLMLWSHRSWQASGEFPAFETAQPWHAPSSSSLTQAAARVHDLTAEQLGDMKMQYLLVCAQLDRQRQHVIMNRNMMLQDDIKEYWGFYLLKGSRVKLSVCSRYEGASFIVVKGLKDARKCSYLGELG